MQKVKSKQTVFQTLKTQIMIFFFFSEKMRLLSYSVPGLVTVCSAGGLAFQNTTTS